MPGITKMFAGYLPGRIRAVDLLSRSLSKEVDILRIGPNITLQSIKHMREFVAVQPSDKASTFRTAIIDLDMARQNLQVALLKILEEPPETAMFILTVSNLINVLSTIQSRCLIEQIYPPTYGAVLRDLTDTGMSIHSSASSARYIAEGYDANTMPDEVSIQRAKALLETCRQRNISMAMKLAMAFDIRSINALRIELVKARLQRELAEMMRATEPDSQALLVVETIINGVRS